MSFKKKIFSFSLIGLAMLPLSCHKSEAIRSNFQTKFVYISAVNGDTAVFEVSYCGLNDDGTIDTCTKLMEFPPGQPVYAIKFQEVNGQKYVYLGGASDQTTYCPVNDDGTLKVEACNTFIQSVTYSYSFEEINEKLYVYLAQDFCEVNDDGIFGNCMPYSLVPLPSAAIATSKSDNSLYAYLISNTGDGLLQSCPIEDNGQITNCTGNLTFLTNGAPFAPVIHTENNNKYLYAAPLGETNIYYCAIGEDGDLVSCSYATPSFTQPSGVAFRKATDGNTYGYVTNGTNVSYCQLTETGDLSNCNETGEFGGLILGAIEFN